MHCSRTRDAGRRPKGGAFIDGNTIQGSAGEAFARRLGAEPGIVDARRILDLRKVPAGRFAELQADGGRARGRVLARRRGPE